MDLTDTLEKDLSRIIGFTNNCDSKSSIVLGSVLAALSLILGLCGKEIRDCVAGEMVPAVIVMVLLVTSIAAILFGLASIVMAIYARGDSAESTIYFGSIASKGFPEYRESVLVRDEESYREDLMSQIHICSVICDKKFKHYKTGLIHSVVGICMLIIVSVLVLLL